LGQVKKIEMISFVLNAHCNYLGVGQGMQASTLTYFSTCPFGQLIKKNTCPTQSFSCPKKMIWLTFTEYLSQMITDMFLLSLSLKGGPEIFFWGK
jgi:hypothetical protein